MNIFFLFNVLILFCLKNDALINDCPKNCVCDDRETIYCTGVFYDNSNDFTSFGTTGLKHLTVTNSTCFPKIWTFICNITSLESLDVTRNRLKELPTNCFKDMKNLVSLRADFNKIQLLQDGVFDGLESLKVLNLSNNMIGEIGSNVFTNVTLFWNLQIVDLSLNLLNSLDSWPFLLSGSYKQITFFRNMISSLTNYANVTVLRGTVVNFEIDLRFNNIQHISDLLSKWTKVKTFHFPWMNRLFSNIKFHGNDMICDCIDYVVLIALFENFITAQMEIGGCNGGRPIHDLNITKIICYVRDDCPDDCICFQRPCDYALVVDCSKRNLPIIPHKFPSRKPMTYLYTIPYKYELLLSHNSISILGENSTVLKHTSSLDLSHGAISLITPGTWYLMRKIKNIFLHNNSLSTLPKEIQFINFTTNRWTLHNNPWSCSCENAWMKDWFKSIEGKLTMKVLCSSPNWNSNKDILTVDFCYQPPFNYQMLTQIIFSTLVIFIFVLVLALLAWRKYRYDIYTKYGLRYIFDSDECLNENMTHDIFLSCSCHDVPVALRFLEKLENELGFNVFYHSRNFPVGGLICDNISDAITRCKRTLCLVSKNFCSSYWCVEEFNRAYLNDIVLTKRRLLVVLLEPLDWNRGELPIEFKSYFQTRTCIEMFKLSEIETWRKLSYCLPTLRSDII